MHLIQEMKSLFKWSLIFLVVSVGIILLLRGIVVFNLGDHICRDELHHYKIWGGFIKPDFTEISNVKNLYDDYFQSITVKK